MTQEPPPRAQSCSHCIYYHDHPGGFGDCHRYPPTFVGGDISTERHRWRHPFVPQHNWCGEFKLRETK
jgi:hypothetical protein